MKQEQKSTADTIEKGNLVSVPFGSSYLQGSRKRCGERPSYHRELCVRISENPQ